MMQVHTSVATVNPRLTSLSEMTQPSATLRLQDTYNIFPLLIATGGAQFCNQTTMFRWSTSLVQSGKYGIQHQFGACLTFAVRYSGRQVFIGVLPSVTFRVREQVPDVHPWTCD